MLFFYLKIYLKQRFLVGYLGFVSLCLLGVPLLSRFSMRQVQELAVTMSLACLSVSGLLLAILLGAFSLWHDVDRRYVLCYLSLPVQRRVYVRSRFGASAIVLTAFLLIVGIVASLVIPIASSFYPSERAFVWSTWLLAMVLIWLKSLLILALSLMLSSVATSFFFPFCVSLAVYLAGGVTQQAHDYLHGSYGAQFSFALRWCVDLFYYVLPNFSLFDLTPQTVYSLTVDYGDQFMSIGYGMTYTFFLLWAAVAVFDRREIS
ncbi:hypothetical protein [uncultured Desulfuromonas sp.]|uniref:hypothetical protein n=1 Tax=uncultured Desulfuromonas sp. TaxID=181013 RepID=UPI002AAC3130|nr:hypothetical protein [uncultured Desulfuromonas sp.]